MRILGIVALAAALAGCAGRAPAPVAIVQPTDRFMDCAAILAEVQANNGKVTALAGDEGGKTAQNVIVGVAGLVVPILWFGMDFQGTAGKEVAALQARQQYLGTLAEQKRCGVEPEPVAAPPRAKRAAKPRPAAMPTAAPPADAPAKQ